MSIAHHLRYDELLLIAENDVIAISSLGGALSNFWTQILKS